MSKLVIRNNRYIYNDKEPTRLYIHIKAEVTLTTLYYFFESTKF